MKSKTYLLNSDLSDYSHFIENCPEGQEDMQGRAMDRALYHRWQPFGEEYQPVTMELYRNDYGKKNYQLDISGFTAPFYVLSERALESLSDIFLPRGQVLPIITASKRKKFWGYFPTNVLKDCFNKEKSIYKQWPNGLMIEHVVLIADNITDEYLFTIEEDIRRVFVTEKFKQRVEEAGLLAFTFQDHFVVETS
ncbi:hypothetical protein A9G41_04350 [Gilliamella sp. Nev5-1]|uniref:hypothetical protein n=1 Tax=unclassified Gilliamella TaxID=2685620 RepID=UPI00080DC682|nr:hypothetical protein [Gilliamella apicola]OCG57544.1 hypothetical protein A9G40_13190 [Gilliamella apicola]OCG70678.1 hypothetical protein A9G41_04350 [Gilliamella apicola]